jgi:hypothetical protein
MTNVLNELARMYERRLDAGRAQRSAPRVADLAATLVRQAKSQAPAAISDDDADTGHPQVIGKPRATVPPRVSVRVQIVARERPQTTAVADARPTSIAPSAAQRPRTAAVPLPPVLPEAAARAGTPEAYRAVAAYDAQLQQYNLARRDADNQDASASQRIRISA